MIITRRSDYAIRICRALMDGNIHNVREICEREDIPKAFAYKIIREMEMNELVKSARGNKGGYSLAKSLDELTIYDIVNTTEENLSLVHCMNEGCTRNTEELPCKIHYELERVQGIMEEELKKKTIAEILGCK